MITLDMTRKAAGKPVTDNAFTLEQGVLTLQVSLGTYSLTGKTVTAAFSPKLVETTALVVTNGIIAIPISSNLIEAGINEIQLNIRTQTTLEQSPIMRWNVLESIFATTSPSQDPDLTTEIQNDLTSRGINVMYPPTPLVAAKGDDTTDDTAALQAIFTYALSNGAFVYIPSGIYKTTSTLYIRNSIRVIGSFFTGWTGTGATIKYYGTGNALCCEVVTPIVGSNDIYGIAIENIRIDSAGQDGDKGISVTDVSELNLKNVKVNHGFNVGFFFNGITISNIIECSATDNAIGMQFAQTSIEMQNASVNIRDCNFWNNSIAHIKINQASGMNISENWFEYSDCGIWLDNDTSINTQIIKLIIEKNTITTGNETLFPDSRSIKVTSTSATIDFQILDLIIEKNLFYNKLADTNIEIDMTNSNAFSYCKGFIEGNLLWGGQTSAIISVGTPYTFKTIFTVRENDCRDGYLGSFNTESTGDILKYGVVASQPLSVATDVAGLKQDFNTLLTSLANARIMI